MTTWERLKHEFSKGNSAIRKLILINAAVFLFTILLGFFAHLYKLNPQDLIIYLEVPSWPGEFIKRPWTIITYMFLHTGIWHLVFNMLLLYYIGRIAEDFMPKQRIYKLYLGGGIAGGILYMLVYSLFPAFAELPTWVPMLGASAAVSSVVIATATLVPNYELFLFGVLRLRLIWLALAMVLSDILFFPSGNEGGRLSHLGGALFGFLFMRYVQGKINIPEFRNPLKSRHRVFDEKDILRNKKGTKPKQQSDKGPNHPRQEEIDAILDKINQSGYASLSQGEKDLLFRASE